MTTPHITITTCPTNEKQNGDPNLLSIPDSIYTKIPYTEEEDEANDVSSSWWYQFFLKCNYEDHDVTKPSWQPKLWPKLCPHPYCPTYRQVARVLAMAFIGIFSWSILYAIVGEHAAPPNGKLFQLILLSISAHFSGWLVSLTTLPNLVGMLAVGMLFQNTNIVNIDEQFTEITNELSRIALVVILVRAGLDLDPDAMRRLKYNVLKLSLIPWTVEATTVTVLSKFLLEIPWMYAVLLGTIVAAVAPAVVVPCLFRLRSKGYGVVKGIPTLIIAVASIGDSTSVAIFGVVKSIMFSETTLVNTILLGPLSVLGGVAFGVIWGTLCSCIPEKGDPFVGPLRVLMLLAGGMLAVFASEMLGYGGAGPLGCVIAAFVALSYWTQQGWHIEDNPASTAFEIFWRIFQPILFSIAGARIKFHELDTNVVLTGCTVVIIGVVVRLAATTVVGIGCKLNLKEKVFVGIAWMCKAIVQAALGPVALSMVSHDSEEYKYAEKVLTTCVLSIIITVPTGALLTTILGPRFLTKTKQPKMTALEIKRRYSRRPSIRDISIIEEDEEDSDADSEVKEKLDDVKEEEDV
ncbi:unnamed protein product [Callosobruchus maculatus]|uniref:Cation/H+ exchanger transmembrane domain-containing protein n=1 Tax=Callosobruchus maculatus TaxID=64391 RepID=A0A653BNN2_CALMS|nr:unnamed protein product [Callosobruchus maculatus]